MKKLFKQYGYRAKALYGDMDTMKTHLIKGTPVIMHTTFFRDSTHFSVVIGYDEEYVFLVDSVREKANSFGDTAYNRKLTYRQFEKIWCTDSYPMNNVYVNVDFI